jgi:CMP-N,N'-diacetyllegionaminic acid synthase
MLIANGQTHSVVAIVPARGGSRKVPRKNVRIVGGKPMIAWTLEAARACTSIDRTIVSTDDSEIAAVAREYGGDVPYLRPAELAGDDVTDLPVFQHALSWLDAHDNWRPDIVVHLRPTAPLRRAEHIRESLELLCATGGDSVRSVCAAGQHPYKCWRLEGRELRPFLGPLPGMPEPYNCPRQALPPAYVQNGSVDVTWRRTIMDMSSMTGRRIVAYEMDDVDSVNVDHDTDLLLADLLLTRRQAVARL